MIKQKEKFHVYIMIVFILLSEVFATAKRMPTVSIIPSLQKRTSHYRHPFPFDKADSENMEEAILRNFYRLLVNSFNTKTRLEKAEVKDPDAFPFYEKAEYRNLFKNEEGIIEVPGSKFEFTFEGKSPEYVFQIDSLEIYSNSAVNNHESTLIPKAGLIPNLIVGAISASKNAESKRKEGGIAIQFNYFIWNNREKIVEKFGCCRVGVGSTETTKEDWEDLVGRAIKDIFYSTKFCKSSY